jgi:hypothetical protein
MLSIKPGIFDSCFLKYTAIMIKRYIKELRDKKKMMRLLSDVDEKIKSGFYNLELKR